MSEQEKQGGGKTLPDEVRLEPIGLRLPLELRRFVSRQGIGLRGGGSEYIRGLIEADRKKKGRQDRTART